MLFVLQKRSGMKVNILGTEYTVEEHKISEDEIMKKRQLAGYHSEESHKIVYADMSETDYIDLESDAERDTYRKQTIRHEIVHAFLSESGLSASSSEIDAWAKNEEMVDWIAIQLPKIIEACKTVGAL